MTRVRESFLRKIFHIISEPMFLLLLGAAIIYFILGEPRDGAIMLIFVLGIVGIEVFQEWKTDRTLNALKDLSAPHITVIRDGVEQVIASADLVPGDLMIIYEGVKIPADGVVIKCNVCAWTSHPDGRGGRRINTDRKTPKPLPTTGARDYCYAGTLVTQGTATVLVDKIGAAKVRGKSVRISRRLRRGTRRFRNRPDSLAPDVRHNSGISVRTWALTVQHTDHSFSTGCRYSSGITWLWRDTRGVR